MKPQEFAIPGHDRIKLYVHGNKEANGLAEQMAQGFFVTFDDVAIPRCDLTPEERAAVSAFMAEHWPQHAAI